MINHFIDKELDPFVKILSIDKISILHSRQTVPQPLLRTQKSRSNQDILHEDHVQSKIRKEVSFKAHVNILSSYLFGFWSLFFIFGTIKTLGNWYQILASPTITVYIAIFRIHFNVLSATTSCFDNWHNIFKCCFVMQNDRYVSSGVFF